MITNIFDSYGCYSCKVNSTCLIAYDRNRYSVDCQYVNQQVTVHAYATKIKVFAGAEQIAEHNREFGRDKTIFNPWHYLPLLERKPGALRNGAPFMDWELPLPILQVKDILMARKQGDRECASILIAMSEYSVEEVSKACALAITEKAISSSKYIKPIKVHNQS